MDTSYQSMSPLGVFLTSCHRDPVIKSSVMNICLEGPPIQISVGCWLLTLQYFYMNKFKNVRVVRYSKWSTCNRFCLGHFMYKTRCSLSTLIKWFHVMFYQTVPLV